MALLGVVFTIGIMGIGNLNKNLREGFVTKEKLIGNFANHIYFLRDVKLSSKIIGSSAILILEDQYRRSYYQNNGMTVSRIQLNVTGKDSVQLQKSSFYLDESFNEGAYYYKLKYSSTSFDVEYITLETRNKDNSEIINEQIHSGQYKY